MKQKKGFLLPSGPILALLGSTPIALAHAYKPLPLLPLARTLYAALRLNNWTILIPATGIRHRGNFVTSLRLFSS